MITILNKANFHENHRSPQHCHQLCTYRVGELSHNGHATTSANHHVSGNAFAMFLKSQRKWENPPLQDDHRDQFIAFCKDHKYDAAR